MAKYLLTAYTIHTVLVTVDADDIEEAKEKFDKGEGDLSVLNIPETTYHFISEPFEDGDPS